MTTAKFLEYMNSGRQVTAECGVHQTMHKLSQEAIRITMEINSRYHTPDEINTLMSELIGGRAVPAVLHRLRKEHSSR